MKRRALSLLILLGWLSAGAQVVVTTQLPPVGLHLKSQLWTLTLVNTGAVPAQVQLEVSFTEAFSNQRVFTGVTSFFTIPKGAKALRHADVQPVQYNLTDPNYQLDAGVDGFLPVGVFQVCYSVLAVNGDAVVRVAEECETVSIEPLSPVQLTYPFDGEVVSGLYPVFSWLPPAPLQLFTQLQYDWKVVEMVGGQLATDAVQENIPLVFQGGLGQQLMQYPVGAQALDTGRRYAWQVVVRNGGNVVSQSEAWTFTYAPLTQNGSAAESIAQFVRMKPREEEGAVIVSDQIRILYEHELSDSLVGLRLYKLDGARKQPVALQVSQLVVSHGLNPIVLPAKGASWATAGKQYLLEVMNSRGQRHYLPFKFQP